LSEPFRKVLIANRGEIALRIIRACREEGLKCVAVYSEADRRSPHALRADEAIEIGPASAAESYLDIARLLAAAKQSGAGAIHPGYGFLAENAAFARAVVEAGLVFIGPSPEAIDAMGDKTRARERMTSAGIPVVPGSDPVASAEEALAAAQEIGFPVMLKAAAGGGGKGMHRVSDPADLTASFERATREAAGAFGDGRVYVERYLENPRHIEFQIVADTERTIHLGERECSIQRRHQKLIEEAPSAAVDAALRKQMGDVAVRVAEAVDYRGVGTVEFLVEEGTFYFLEMNTRIQVEHPVTEAVTGVDLVREQLRIARGLQALDGADPPEPRGHAIECRISAEDPARGFLPSTGRIEGIEIPTGPGVRWDGGIRTGFEVGLHYDPLLGKLIVHAADRARAIDRMRTALEELRIDGVETTQPYHLAVMSDADFRANDLSIRYVEEHPDLLSGVDADLFETAIGVAVLLEAGARGAVETKTTHAQGSRALSAWVREGRTW